MIKPHQPRLENLPEGFDEPVSHFYRAEPRETVSKLAPRPSDEEFIKMLETAIFN